MGSRQRSVDKSKVAHETRTTSASVNIEAPEELEPPAMLAGQGIGLENQDKASAIPQAAGQEWKNKAVGASEASFPDLALQEEELLAEQGILEQQLGLSGRGRSRVRQRTAPIGSSQGRAVRAKRADG
jgi:hypothetical protein